MTSLLIAGYFAQSRWRRLRSRAAVDRLQERYVRRQFRFLRRHSPYFATLPRVDSVADLGKLPVMDKESMMANFNRLNTVGLDRDRALEIAVAAERSRDFSPTYRGVSVGLSSGTSGHRGLFIVSDRERCAWAGAVLARFLPSLSGQRIAFFLRANNNLYETVNSRVIQFRFFDVYRPMAEHIAALGSYRPTVVVAPPSVLSVLADAVVAGELRLHPARVISVAEVLTSFDERRFREVFGQEVIFQAYQCTEGFLGYTCPFGSVHLNEDICYFEKEFVDDSRFVPIITDFRRRSQPIVRYRLNDVLTLAADQACGCGQATTVVAKIAGREDDVFSFPAVGGGGRVLVFPDMVERCFLYVSGVSEFRVERHSDDRLVVFVAPLTGGVMDRVRAELDGLAGRLGFVPPRVEFEPYVADSTHRRKRKRVENCAQ